MNQTQRKAQAKLSYYQNLVAQIDAQLPASFKGTFSLQDGQLSRSNTPPSVFKLLKEKERCLNEIFNLQEIINGNGSSKSFRGGLIYG